MKNFIKFDGSSPELLNYIKNNSSCRVQRLLHQLNKRFHNFYDYILYTITKKKISPKRRDLVLFIYICE